MNKENDLKAIFEVHFLIEYNMQLDISKEVSRMTLKWFAFISKQWCFHEIIRTHFIIFCLCFLRSDVNNNIKIEMFSGVKNAKKN